MKNIFAFATALIIATGVQTGAQAAEAEAKAGGQIISALEMTRASDLYFGSIVPNATQAGTVEVSSGGALTCGDNLTCLGDDISAAGFKVRGEADHGYTVTLPDTVTISNGSATMTISELSDSVSGESAISDAGTDDFSVGGRLSVAAAQASGVYSGTFNVLIEYN